MLTELRVRDLGVIHELELVFDAGLTAVTGETGAGKTLVVEAINLLSGGRAGAEVVRAGASEARVDGRFRDLAGEERVLSRVVPADGRSRAYVDGAPATAAALSETARHLVDLHGQHDHQTLLSPATQRAALDSFGSIDQSAVRSAQAAVQGLEQQLAAVGGDPRERERELDVLRHQVREITAAGIQDGAEDERLAAEEALLADAAALRAAVFSAREAIAGDGGAVDRLGDALSALSGRPALEEVAGRAGVLASGAGDLAIELAELSDRLVEDPRRLDEVVHRRGLLRELCRKYGDSLEAVSEFGRRAAERLEMIETASERAANLEADLRRGRAELQAAQHELAAARRAVAGPLGEAVQGALRNLALPKAQIRVEVDGEDGSEVCFLLSANPGEAPRPLTKVASGGELSRAMLALRLVLTGLAASGAPADEIPRTIVFDEVDAGIGGEAAVEVGRALAAVARRHQVLVVTHLPQVAAFADHQVAVSKREHGERVETVAAPVTGRDRVVELSRMLSGQPGSESARGHAAELLESAAAERTAG